MFGCLCRPALSSSESGLPPGAVLSEPPLCVRRTSARAGVVGTQWARGGSLWSAGGTKRAADLAFRPLGELDAQDCREQ